MKHFGLIQDSNSNVPAPHRSAERGNLGNWIYWGSRLTIIFYSTQNKKLNTPESGLITRCSSNVQFKFKSSRQCLWIIWPPYPNPIVVFGHCFFHRQTLHYILIQVRCLMSIYKDAKMTFFEFCFSECNTSHFQLQEISLIVKKWEPIVSVLFLLMIAGKFIIGL